jgi:hypothetical protein
MVLMPDALQLATIPLMLFLLSKAVLAVVVNQTPRIAFTSQTGGNGGVGVGVGVGAGAGPGLFFSLQADMPIKKANNGTIACFKNGTPLFITNKIYYKT